MANIRTGSIVSDIRGKVGTEIYSRNRGGAYVKAHGGYTENWNARQISAQAAIAEANARWAALTELQRIQWDSFARNFKAQKTFEKGIRSGRELFLQRCFNRIYYRSQPNVPLPVFVGPLNFSNEIIASASAGAQSLSIQGPLNIKNNSYVWNISFSRCVPITRRSVNSVTFNYSGISQLLNNNTATAGPAHNAVYGAGSLVAGERLFIRRFVIALPSEQIVHSVYRSLIVGS